MLFFSRLGLDLYCTYSDSFHYDDQTGAQSNTNSSPTNDFEVSTTLEEQIEGRMAIWGGTGIYIMIKCKHNLSTYPLLLSEKFL